ncbi:hypothetical protein Ahy_A09g041867 isoform D [Arachis hypogaea]|uniref:Uncharacterized protein n=1 Tax=Arachis hypogaea TaxID=3818 RepID=A0A445BE43_ARAHY|nr:hypothetical protein Ahy_A09g041867 isoform D [Arachis hypogaea]
MEHRQVTTMFKFPKSPALVARSRNMVRGSFVNRANTWLQQNEGKKSVNSEAWNEVLRVIEHFKPGALDSRVCILSYGPLHYMLI